MQKKIRLLFVCLGNICRSPAAEGIMQALVQSEGLESWITCDSAGTNGYHNGQLADARMRKHASLRGYNLQSISRKFEEFLDFDEADYILVMDENNHTTLCDWVAHPEQKTKIRYMTDFCEKFSVNEVPDPYYGGAAGFEEVLDILEDATHGLLKYLKTEHPEIKAK